MHDEECYDSIPLVVQKTEQQKVQTVQEQRQKAGQIRCRTLSSALFHLSYSIPDIEKVWIVCRRQQVCDIVGNDNRTDPSLTECFARNRLPFAILEQVV